MWEILLLYAAVPVLALGGGALYLWMTKEREVDNAMSKYTIWHRLVSKGLRLSMVATVCGLLNSVTVVNERVGQVAVAALFVGLLPIIGALAHEVWTFKKFWQEEER